MDPPLDSLPNRPLTKEEAKALTTPGEVACPTLWTRSPASGDEAEEAVVAVLLLIDDALHHLAYDDGWTHRVLTDDVTKQESFTALELAVHAQLQDRLGLPDDQFTMYRNEAARPTS